MKSAANKVAIAIGAHPDDIEFTMAGTLLRLRDAGWETHYLNLSSGNCGSLVHDGKTLIAMRRTEAQRAAKILGAHFHPSLSHDLEIVYDLKLLRRLASIIREVKPSVVLTHSPQDYMEDHTNTCRLAVTAAFSRCLANFKTVPARPHFVSDVTVYHAMPHGLCDSLGRRIIAGAYVNTAEVQDVKLAALTEHKSQQDWLDASQKMNSYLQTMEDFSRVLGRQSKRFKLAEGWRKHLHLGFCAEGADPLREALGRNYLVNRAYQKALEKGG